VAQDVHGVFKTWKSIIGILIVRILNNPNILPIAAIMALRHKSLVLYYNNIYPPVHESLGNVYFG